MSDPPPLFDIFIFKTTHYFILGKYKICHLPSQLQCSVVRPSNNSSVHPSEDREREIEREKKHRKQFVLCIQPNRFLYNPQMCYAYLLSPGACFNNKMLLFFVGGGKKWPSTVVNSLVGICIDKGVVKCFQLTYFPKT